MKSLLIGILVLAAVSGVLITYKMSLEREGDQGKVVDVPSAQESPETTGGNTYELDEPALDLSYQNLTRVPQSVFEQKNLTALNVSHNALSGALQGEVRQLQNLRVLIMSDNHFTGVPAEIGQLSHLEILDLSNNELTGLPHEIGNLSNLKKLDLRGNQPSTYDLQVIRAQLPNTVILLDLENGIER